MRARACLRAGVHALMRGGVYVHVEEGEWGWVGKLFMCLRMCMGE